MSSHLSSPFDLAGRVAVVTGGSNGLGAAAAQSLAEARAHVVLVARGREKLQTQAELCRLTGAQVSVIEGDVSKSNSAHSIVEEAIRKGGALHILVNAAGAITRGALAEATNDDFDRVMRVNAFGLWSMCRAASTVMQPGSAIINVTSTAGLVGMSDRSAYAASKGAAVQITRSLAVELAPRGIRVNAVAPGPFVTDMSSSSQATERWRRLINERVPLGRAGEAREIGPPIVFLASSASSFITGVVLAVDGGWTAS
jgi:NAD(P)-dependent dehydrogenase (short-subunit alcohol dehydrogenase family)